MPDVHMGKGCTVGTVIPTKTALIPAAVGVDIGCGMCAVKTSLKATDLKSLASIRNSIEKVIPVGFGKHEKGNMPNSVVDLWDTQLNNGFERILNFKDIKQSYRDSIEESNHINHLGTLGGGNHFIEICLDETDQVWIMLHSGSRGVGNMIGRVFIDLAKEDMLKTYGYLPNGNQDLAYLTKGTSYFDEYWFALNWASDFAKFNRKIMMEEVIKSLRRGGQVADPNFKADLVAVNCHHNYAQLENHFGEDLYITRKGAVSAKKGELGIIPGSMGKKSYIVIGKGNADSYCSCSHGAGRKLSRGQAKKTFTVQDLRAQTKDVECRKDEGVLDEIPEAYKDIDAVMESQKDLVDILYTLKQIVCVKG